ncbi:ABC transporter ATP-binding protein [Streptomyces sp. NRRL S-1448]|uniref:ABC transporter ATP-binding protein n=1 Tax=Streptomyces sp. NRRL S-1448 TaxID=1463883 RepID=UPI00099BEBFB|nr:ABC transporter ATP-binding protein [Streptomyces sp. NRRL S-1448]
MTDTAVTPRGRRATRGTGARVTTAWSLAAKAAPGTLVAYVLLTLATGGLPVATALLTKRILDHLVAGASTGTLTGLGLCLAAVGVVTGAAPQVGQYLRAELDRRVGLLMQDRLFTAVDGFVGLERFENPRFLDRLRLAQQTAGGTPNETVSGALGIVRAAVTLTGFIGSLLALSPVLTGLVLVAGVPVLCAEIALSRRRARMVWDIGPAERRELFYNDLLSSMEAAKEVRLFGIGGFLRGRMLAERRTSDAAKRAVDRREVRAQAGLGLLAALISGCGLVWAVGAARSGDLSAGDVTLFVAAVAGVQGALAALALEVARTHQALLLLDHYLAVTTAGPDLPLAAEPRPLPALSDGIELRDVWFRYSDAHPWILRGVSLRIPHGQALALVGLNGAGKSTLVKLLCRFYDPTRGAILWDGVDLREVDVTAYRRRLSVVFQDYMHYDMTAAENIALGDLDALHDDQRLRTAAERAGIHQKLAGLPHGYRTLLSRLFFTHPEGDGAQSGVMLSGGQWQRLALARAFLREGRDLMILDEPSAGLDAAAEHEIHAALCGHRGDRTGLLISHRLSAVRDADRIVVLKDGLIAEQGSHDALMALDGEYARLFTLQATGYRTDGEPVGAGPGAAAP